MAMIYTPLPDEFLEEMEELSDAEYGRLIRWAQHYHLTGEQAGLSGNERFYAKRVKMQIDRVADAYKEKCDKARASARMRWDANASDAMRDDANNANTKPKPKPISPNGDNNKRFAPPTLEQVTAYCRERKNSVDPQRFIDYYTSNGWRVGKNPMKDWKAAVRQWESREKEAPVRKNSPAYFCGDHSKPDPLVLKSIQQLFDEEGEDTEVETA